jgi:hypothetical protein
MGDAVRALKNIRGAEDIPLNRPSGDVVAATDSPMELSLTLDLNGKKERVSLRSGSAITISSPFDLQVVAEQWNKTQMGNTLHE